MRNSQLGVTIFCLSIIIFPTIKALAEKPDCEDASMAEENKSVIFDKSKIISQTKTAEVYCGEMNKYTNTFTLEISYSEGKKSFLKFRGRQYKLRIVYDDENDHIEYANFTFADTSEADKSINVKYDLGKRPNKEIKEELKRWFDLAIAFLEKENPKADQQLIDIFDLRPFYEEYVKPFIAQQLNK